MSISFDGIIMLFVAICTGLGAGIGMYIAIRLDQARLGIRMTVAEKTIDTHDGDIKKLFAHVGHRKSDTVKSGA